MPRLTVAGPFQRISSARSGLETTKPTVSSAMMILRGLGTTDADSESEI
jgi:hypothetical protein